MIRIKKIKLYQLEYKIKNFIYTSFGIMRSRPALIIELIDNNNNIGLGEIWCNFPNDAPLYKFKLFKNIFAKILINKNINKPSDILTIYEDIKKIFIQSDDLGSYNSILSGLDCALWELFSKKKKKPLNKFINNNSLSNIGVYASGINPNDATKYINLARKSGIKAFKVKIGFDNNLDLSLIKKIIAYKNANEKIMLDVNQGWVLEKAVKYLNILKKYPIYWIEEPISAISKETDYIKLINFSKISIALGENINCRNKFKRFLNNKELNFIQPDLTKFGGISLIEECFKNKFKNKIFLHFLGSGVGLINSAHVMSAINKKGLLETDLNTNPLRDLLFKQPIKIFNGKLHLNDLPGIGFTLNKNIIKKYLINSFSI